MVVCGRTGRLRLLSLAFSVIFVFYFIHYKGNETRKDNSQYKLNGLHQTELEQIRRKNHISKLCSQYGYNSSLESLEPSSLDHFIVDDDHKIIYCYIPKVACTNWKRIFMALKDGKRKNPLAISGNETHSYEFKTLLSHSKEEIKKKLEKYMKFLFVRHPYERLLSAYRNKFEKIYSTYFWERFGRKIVKQYRKNPRKTSLDKGHDVTFMEFLQYITDLDIKNKKVSFNEHWRPMFDLCLPCTVNYDVVGKYKTLEEDADYTLWRAGLSGVVSFPRREDSYRLQRSSDLMSSYYHNISKQVIFKLKDIYKNDFMLFEYNASLWN